MRCAKSVAVLVDGGFVTKILRRQLGHFPDADEVESEIAQRILRNPALADRTLYRVFFYDADPWAQPATNPITRTTVDYAATDVAIRGKKLLQQLELKTDYAVRRGVLACHGWKLGRSALVQLRKAKGNAITGHDLVPDFEQKGVDMRIGLDMASLALKRLVDTVVLVTGDSDMVPAMKFARREGLRVYLHTLGSTMVRPELRVHADVVLS